MIALTAGGPPTRIKSVGASVCSGALGTWGLAWVMALMCAHTACKPRPKASADAAADLADMADAPMRLSGVTLVSRQNDTITLTARIGDALGDLQKLHLRDVTLTSPDGVQVRTSEATWDVAEHAIEAPGAVIVQHPHGRLTATGATLDPRSGALELRGPVQGDLDAPAPPPAPSSCR